MRRIVNKDSRTLLGSVLARGLIAVLVVMMVDGSVLAQGGEQLGNELLEPRPAESEGSAEWVVSQSTYTGEFPEGMTFSTAVESSGGAITSAQVIWVHAPGSGTQRSRGATFDEDTGLWVAEWEHARGDVPPWVLVRYRWEFADEAGNRYTTAETDEVYADADNADRWRSMESEDVVVYYMDLPDAFGEAAVEAMAVRHEFYRQAWGGNLPFRPRVILYANSAFDDYELALGRQAIAGGGIVTGTTSEDWGGTLQYAMPSETPESLAYGTVLHEVAHIYQQQYAHMPVSWFVEGNAEFFAIDRDRDYRQYAYARLSTNEPLSFADGFSIRGEHFRDGYEIGATVFDYLVETYGLDAHRELWELLSENVPRFDAIEAVTGISIQQFETDWRRWLGIMSPPPTPFPTPTPSVDIFNMPTATPFTFGG